MSYRQVAVADGAQFQLRVRDPDVYPVMPTGRTTDADAGPLAGPPALRRPHTRRSAGVPDPCRTGAAPEAALGRALAVGQVRRPPNPPAGLGSAGTHPGAARGRVPHARDLDPPPPWKACSAKVSGLCPPHRSDASSFDPAIPGQANTSSVAPFGAVWCACDVGEPRGDPFAVDPYLDRSWLDSSMPPSLFAVELGHAQLLRERAGPRGFVYVGSKR